MSRDNKFVRSLIQSSLQGNSSSLEQLYNMNLPKIYTLTLRLTANAETADKLTQDVLVEAWKQLGYLRDDATFTSWISSITVYQCLKYLRENENPKHLDVAHLPSKDHLEKTILDLPKNERISFILHYFEKYSVDEVADLLAIRNNEAQIFLEEGERMVTAKNPDITSKENLAENIKRIKVDLIPKTSLIKQALTSIYRIKSEEEFKENYISEHSEEDKVKDKQEAEDQEKEKKGFGGLFKKFLPKKK